MKPATFALLLSACGTIPMTDAPADATTPDVGLTSDARRLDAGSLAAVELCAGSTGCQWRQTDDGTVCTWHAVESAGEWHCKVDGDGNVYETLCAIGGDYCYPPTVVDSWEACGERAELYACGNDL